MFILHGNVYDVVLNGEKMLGLTEFLTDILLKESRESIVVYNVSSGARFPKRTETFADWQSIAVETDKAKVLTMLERSIRLTEKTAVIFEYAETLAPAGDASFQMDADRAAIVTLHRWSFLPEIERGDNIIILIAENIAELAPKIVSNPKISTIEIPMPDFETRKKVVELTDARLSEEDFRRYAEVTAGLKSIQISSILTAAAASRRRRARPRKLYCKSSRKFARRKRTRAQTCDFNRRNEPRRNQKTRRARRKGKR